MPGINQGVGHAGVEQLAKLVEVQQPEQILKFAHLDEASMTTLSRLDADTYQAMKNDFEGNALETARELLADAAFADRVDRLPFQPHATVVGIGDSSTADRQSWLEILRHLLELRRPHDEIRVINQGVAGQTTTQALASLSLAISQQPAWIICCLGSNDAARYGLQPTKSLVSLEETTGNLVEMRRRVAVQTQAQWVWLTPPTVDEARITLFPPFQLAEVSWRNEDLEVIGDILCYQPDLVVDIQAVFGCPPVPEFLQLDGLQPSLAGQKAIAQVLVERLAG